MAYDKSTTDMSEGSAAEEAAESTAKESQEQAAGQGDQSDAIKVPEQFQKDVYAVIDTCTNQEQCDFVRSCLSTKQSELMKAEDQFTDTDMPQD